MSKEPTCKSCGIAYAEHLGIEGTFREREANSRAAETLATLNRLREPECTSITIHHPNPDFGGPNQIIEVYSHDLGWKNRRFEGNSLEDCLIQAEKAANE